MQIVSSEDDLHEMSYPVFREKKIRKISSNAELAQRVVKVKEFGLDENLNRPVLTSNDKYWSLTRL